MMQHLTPLLFNLTVCTRRQLILPKDDEDTPKLTVYTSRDNAISLTINTETLMCVNMIKIRCQAIVRICVPCKRYYCVYHRFDGQISIKNY